MRSLVPRSVGPWLAVLTLTAAGTAAAVGYDLTAPPRYRATAQLLVSPVSTDDPTFTGLDVLRDSAGRHSAAASAAALVRSPQVADAVRADLGLARSRDSLLAALDAFVVGASDVVAVSVEDTSAAGAAQLANAFADGLVKERTASFQSQLAATIRREQQLLAAIPAAQRGTGAGLQVQQRLAVLQGFQGQPDPTIRHAAQASAPSSPYWPKLPALAALGAGAGLAAGLVAALALVLVPFARRRGAGAPEPFERGVSDRLAERLEQRVNERIAALETERERLSGREAALQTREREVAAKLAELREAAEAHVAPVLSDTPARDEGEAPGARAALLDARVAELTQRELGLARRAGELARREQALAAREAALAARPAEPVLVEPAAAPVAAPAPLPAEPLPAEPPRPEPPSVEPPPLDRTAAWNLMVLERLVHDRGEEFPDRREEWLSYLYFLREYAEPDGTVPSRFDGLIEDAFSELVA